MYYCRHFSDENNSGYLLPFIDKVDFGYKKSDDEQSIKIYLRQIKTLKGQHSSRYLDLDEEVELFKRIEKGDKEAKEIIFINFLPFVPRIVKYYVGHGVAIEDLIQEGNLALFDAIDTFDYRKGFRFSTHAKWRIRGKVRKEIPFYLTSFDIPTDSVLVLSKINKIFEEASMEGFRETSIFDTVDIGFNSKKELNLFYMMNSTSLNDLKNEDLESIQDISELDLEEEMVMKQLSDQIQSIMENYLTDREENVIRLLYGLDDGRERTYEEVGKIFGISRERIRQLKIKALEKLVNYF